MREPLRPPVAPAPVAKPVQPAPDLVPDLDSVAARRWRNRVRMASPWLHEEIGQRMAQRLDWLVQPPSAWVSWHPLLGGLQAQQAVQTRYPAARWQALDDQGRAAHATPIAPGQADMLWANMALHLYARPQALLACWRDWLRPEGLLFFSGLGPDTLLELRRLYAALGWPPPHPPYTDMHDWGDMLVQAGFNAPVLDMERLSLSYPSAERLLQDLRDGGRNLHLQRPEGLRGRAHRQRLLHALEQQLPRTADGHLCLTVEVVYGHALKSAPRVPVAASSSVALDDMRTLLRQPRSA